MLKNKSKSKNRNANNKTKSPITVKDITESEIYSNLGQNNSSIAESTLHKYHDLVCTHNIMTNITNTTTMWRLMCYVKLKESSMWPPIFVFSHFTHHSIEKRSSHLESFSALLLSSVLKGESQDTNHNFTEHPQFIS